MRIIHKNRISRIMRIAGRTMSKCLLTVFAAVPAVLIILPLVITLTNSLMSEAEINYSYFSTLTKTCVQALTPMPYTME